MFCHKCGQKAEEGAKFCFACGSQLHVPSDPTEPDQRQEILKASDGRDYEDLGEGGRLYLGKSGDKKETPTELNTQIKDDEVTNQPASPIAGNLSKTISEKIPMEGPYLLWFLFFITVGLLNFFLEISMTEGGETQNQFPAFIFGVLAWNTYKRNLSAMVWLSLFMGVCGAFLFILGISTDGENAYYTLSGDYADGLVALGIAQSLIGFLMFNYFKALKAKHVLH